MARIVMIDDGIAFDGAHAETSPLGGAESAFVGLAEGLAARGHEVVVHNRCVAPIVHKDVSWRPLSDETPDTADLYIANRGDRLIPLVPRARARIFWIHNPAVYLLKWRYLSKLVQWRPVIVFSGASHAATYPRWAPSGGRVIIPYGVPDAFCHADERAPPGPRAIFTSSPLRSLDWLLTLWSTRIQPSVPGAELHVFSGTATYGAVGQSKSGTMMPVLERAAAMAASGVILRGTVPKSRLVEELPTMRAYLYRGDINETYCMSAAEAQAMGIPGVVQDLGSMRERIEHEKTGFVTRSDDAFVTAAVRLLTDDALWREQHRQALATQRRFGWAQAAASFETLLPGMKNS